jgi:hypothetical protein
VKLTSNEPVAAPIVTGPVAEQVKVLLTMLQLMFPLLVMFMKLPTVTVP